MTNLSIGTLLLAVLALVALLLLERWVMRRGPQEFACPRLLELAERGDGSALIREIQRDAFPPAEQRFTAARRTDSLSLAIESAVGGTNLKGKQRGRNFLLLSGGGQWGAYGAGLFQALSEDNKPVALPDIRIITGISTGSLQTLLLMVALDPDKSAETRKLAIERLVAGYSPDNEREIVRNTTMYGVPLSGSQAGTGPLRTLIGKTLHPKKGQSLIAEIASSTIDGFIGFVEADTGDFRYVHVNKVVEGLEPKQAVECLAAAAMASSAMPVFHQQVRVFDEAGNPRALYDGGVRHSVFFDGAMERLDEAVRESIAKSPPALAKIDFAGSYRATAPTVYVVRNGPTVRTLDTNLNTSDGVIANGKRGYDLLVNQSEIGAIAALRLYNPYGNILVTTADQPAQGAGKPPCMGIKNEKKMFDPDFMTCLRELGASKARRAVNGEFVGPWWPLSPLEPPPGA